MTSQWISTHDEKGNEWLVPSGSAWKIISKTDSPDGDETIMTLENGAGKRMDVYSTKQEDVT